MHARKYLTVVENRRPGRKYLVDMFAVCYGNVYPERDSSSDLEPGLFDLYSAK